MKTSSKSIAALLGAAAIVATPALAFADSTPAPAATHAPSAAAQARHAAVAARHAARTAANDALKSALASATTKADRVAARAAHKAAIAALPAKPVSQRSNQKSFTLKKGPGFITSALLITG